MRTKLKHIIREKPLFLFLLPVFFVWHGYVEFYALISFPKALLLILYYLIGTIAVFLLSWILFKNRSKASLFGFLIMCLYFFFGGVQDFLQKKFPGAFINKYSFLLSALLVLFIFFFFILKKYKKRFTKIILYLNALLLILVLVDSTILIEKILAKNNAVTAGKPLNLKSCDQCPKPDIYLILADGYSGKIALRDFFHYDNSGFEDQLRQRGFYVVDSSFANYNYTLFSIGSMLNMDYLKTASSFKGETDLPISFNAIRDSKLIKFLERQQYDIFNFSIFDIDNHPSSAKKTLMNFEKSPITSQTFLFRLNRDIGYHLITTLRLNFLHHNEPTNLFDNLDNNNKLDSLTKNISATRSIRPKFIYTHLVMPHWPYYFDSVANKTPAVKLNDDYNFDKGYYISYLKFTNKKLIELIDYIRSNNSKPSIIILMSDHGFRNNEEDERTDPNYINRYQFINLNAVFFPDQNYTGFYKGMSNVNQFRVMLNSQFGQHLDLLKDSFTIIKQ